MPCSNQLSYAAILARELGRCPVSVNRKPRPQETAAQYAVPVIHQQAKPGAITPGSSKTTRTSPADPSQAA